MVSFIRVFLLTVLAVSGLSTAAHASAEYRVWYFDDNFNEDVRVWLGKPGCSESLGIECSDNSQSFPHESGGSYMEINTNYGYSWINDEGGWPTCGNCVGPDDRSVRAIDRLGKDVAALLPALLAQVVRRRAVYLLADLEPSVRALEDAALANLHDASQLVSSCMARAKLGRFADAYAACTVGGERLDGRLACSSGAVRVPASSSLKHPASFFILTGGRS